jgi:hypothetical protein
MGKHRSAMERCRGVVLWKQCSFETFFRDVIDLLGVGSGYETYRRERHVTGAYKDVHRELAVTNSDGRLTVSLNTAERRTHVRCMGR